MIDGANTGTTETMAATEATQDYRKPAASAAMVNRTHRVIRQRAQSMQARRQTMRSLYIPLAVSAALLASVVFAIWTVLDEYDLAPTGMPDASQQIFVLMMWCLPISLAVLAVVLFRRSALRGDTGQPDSEGVR